MTDLLSMTPDELAERMLELGEPRYRAGQVFEWLHRGAKSGAEMTNLPLALREKLDFPLPETAERQISSDGTQKLLWRLRDGETVESVLMSYKTGTTICISTQAGCRQGCAFCASTIGGRVRDLTAGEMLAQVLHCGAPVSHVVLMGIGEPLDNFDSTVRFLRLLNHPRGRNMSLRNVTLSTCGLAPEIEKLAELGLPVTLSISLHAPDNALRDRLMPVNKKYPLERLMHSAEIYFDKTCRRVSYEYVMIKGMNDSAGQAEKLAGLVKPGRSHVNLIPLNPVSGKGLEPSAPEVVKKFSDILSVRGIEVTVRRRLGGDIDAACGQLRRERGAAV